MSLHPEEAEAYAFETYVGDREAARPTVRLPQSLRPLFERLRQALKKVRAMLDGIGVARRGGGLRLKDVFADVASAAARAKGRATRETPDAAGTQDRAAMLSAAAHGVSRFLRNELGQRRALRLGPAPPVLRLAGAKDRPMVMSQKVARKVVLDKRRLHPDVLYDLPRLLVNRAMLSMAEQAGIIDANARALWQSDVYVPFYRIIDGEAKTPPAGKAGLEGQRAGIRRLKGSEARIDDPLGNMIANMTRLVDASFRNVAARRTIDLAVQAGAVDRASMKWESKKVSPEVMAEELEAIGGEGQGLSPEQKDQYARIFALRAPAGGDVVSVMAGGRPKYYRVRDDLLLRALTAPHGEKVPAHIRLLGVPKRVLTAGSRCRRAS